jgi:peptidoglycan/xylan/chitin deacetylase (PgdA/CDA1 family)
MCVALAGSAYAVGATPASTWRGPTALSATWASESPSPTASPSSPQPAADDPVNPYRSRIPKFGPAPVAEKVIKTEGNSAPWITRVPTTQRVAFITIDDGWNKLDIAPRLLKEAKVPVTLFLSLDAIQDRPKYFEELQAAGAVIEAHSVTHVSLQGKAAATQQHEICGSADRLNQWYGRRPILFRPPYGNKDATTLSTAHTCGMKGVVFWTETVDKGVVRYQVGNQIQPGDVILMHFRPAFADDFLAALAAIANSGLTPALLEDYIV